MKRALTETEVGIVTKQIVRMEDEIEYASFAVNNAELMVNGGGLTAKQKKEVRDWQKNLADAKAKRLEIEDLVKQLQDQLIHGVEQKDEATQ